MRDNVRFSTARSGKLRHARRACFKSSKRISRVSRDSNSFQAHFKRFQEIARVSRAFQEFQQHRPALEFQNQIKGCFAVNDCTPGVSRVSRVSCAFQEFQEIAARFKSISRGFKRWQEFQEHVSRVTDDARLNCLCRILQRSCGYSKRSHEKPLNAFPVIENNDPTNDEQPDELSKEFGGRTFQKRFAKWPCGRLTVSNRFPGADKNRYPASWRTKHCLKSSGNGQFKTVL